MSGTLWSFLMGALIGGGGGGGGGDAHGIPSGGTTGQVLAKSSGTDYSAGWTTPHYIPSGGGSGQVLAKSSSTNYATQWKSFGIGDLSNVYVTSGNALPLSRMTLVGNNRWEPSRPLVTTVLGEDDGNGVAYIQAAAIPSNLTFSDLVSCGYNLIAIDAETDKPALIMLTAMPYDGDDPDAVDIVWLLDISSQPYVPKIRVFKSEWDEGGMMAFEITPPTHAVTGAWVGTAQEYAALAPNYDSHTIYYIKE